MLLSKTVLSYERQLKELIKKDPKNIPKIKNLLKEAVTLCQNEDNTLRYLRLWLYLATLYRQPLDVCRHLLDKNIGTSHALLYQDVSYHYMTENRKDMAESILRQGISRSAQPLEHLQRSLMELGNGDRGSAPPSVKDPLPTTTTGTEAELPLLMIGLGSENMLGVFDAMELFIQQMARISLFEESEHYDISPDKIRAESSSYHQVKDATIQSNKTNSSQPMEQDSQPMEQDSDTSSLQKMESCDEITNSAQKISSSHPSSTLEMIEQQAQHYTIILFPFTHDYKQSLLEPHLPLNATYELMEPEKLDSLVKELKANISAPLRLNKDTVVYIQGMIGQGTYGTVYLAKWNSKKVAIKIYDLPDRWDHYIHQLIFKQIPDADQFFLRSYALYLGDQISVMVMEYGSQGTLLDCLNTFRDHDRLTVPEPLVQLLMLRLLEAILLLHKFRITHNDIKLDNILMSYNNVYDTSANVQRQQYLQQSSQSLDITDINLDPISVKVIDFSLAVHLNLVAPPSSTAIIMKCHPTSDDEQPHMPAMDTGLPWPPFHLDYWGIANCAHTLLFSTPMTMATPNKLKRYWNVQLWQRFFDVLVVQPPTTWDGCMLALHTLVIDMTSSLKNSTVKNDIIYHLRYYDRYYKPTYIH